MEQELWDKMTKFTPLEKLTKANINDVVNKVEENIWVIPNFISEKEREVYLNYVKDLPEEEWWKQNRNWWVGKYISIENSENLKNIANSLSDRVKEYLAEDVYLGAFGSVHRLTEGQGMFIHTDNPTDTRDLINEHGEKIGETSGHNNYCILAFVLYLNDFNGAELYFPRLNNFQYKAKAGDLVMFPGTGEEYDHGVRPLLPGSNRYITTGFGYDQRVESLKKAQYVFEDVKTGEPVEVEPNLVVNDPEEVMKLPPRPLS
jgi:hypothetical protein